MSQGLLEEGSEAPVFAAETSTGERVSLDLRTARMVLASAAAAKNGPPGTYITFSSIAVARIFSRNAAESWSGRENALETVIGLTPTRSATVFSVTLATHRA